MLTAVRLCIGSIPARQVSSGFLKMEFAAELTNADSVGVRSRGAQDTLDGLQFWFVTQTEGLMVDRQDAVRAGIVGHAQCLLRIAVDAYPRVVRADRHDCQIK